MQYDDMIQRLKDLDEEASLTFDSFQRLHLILVGGGALVLMKLIPRGTHDMDAIEVSSQLQNMLEKYDINTRVQAYYGNFPYNFEDRLTPINIDGKILDVFVLSLEDIVVAKLYAGRPNDIADLESPLVLENLNWDQLHYLATAENEAKLSAINERNYQEFLDAYYEYERRFRKCKD